MSQDPAKNGMNWLVYCNNNPVSSVDQTGENAVDDFYAGLIGGFLLALIYDCSIGDGRNLRNETYGAVMGAVAAYASTWLKEKLLELTSRTALNTAGKILTAACGITCAVAAMWGMHAGEIMFQLMLLDYESDPEVKEGYHF